MFDTLYVGCAEAFSKKGAALARFRSPSQASTMSAINASLIRSWWPALTRPNCICLR